MSQNISTNGIQISVIAVPVVSNAFVIDNLSTDTDPWVVSELETAGAQTSPSGESVFWGMNNRIEATLTLNGASKAGKTLSNLLQLQQRVGNIPPVQCNFQVIVSNELTGNKETYIDGILISGSAGTTYGSQKKGDLVFTFSFAKRI